MRNILEAVLDPLKHQSWVPKKYTKRTTVKGICSTDTKRYHRIYSLLLTIAAYSKQHRLPFDLDLKYLLEELPVPKVCPVLGVPLTTWGHNTRAQLDRAVPSRGYVKGNVQWISAKANHIKSNATLDELVAVVQHVRSCSEK